MTIASSKIHGLGLVATENIEEGVDLGLSHVIDSHYKDGLIRTPLGGFINHSNQPNAKIEVNTNTYRLVTIAPIKKGQELTVNYTGFYSDEVIDSYI